MGITDEYFKYQEEFERKYGPKTIVLMQIGSFYEAYEFAPEQHDADSVPGRDPRPLIGNQRPIGQASEISTILNIILTSKDKSKPHTRENPYLSGFPVVAYEKHRDALLANNFTIVRMDQVKHGKEVERFVAEIVSPATNIDNNTVTSPAATNQIVAIFIECQKLMPRAEDIPIIAGMACIDIATGKNIVSEVYSRDDDKVCALQDIYRFLVAQHPREILITIVESRGLPMQGNPFAESYIQYVRETLELNKYPNVVFRVSDIQRDYLNVNYQKQFLTKIYSTATTRSPTKNSPTRGLPPHVVAPGSDVFSSGSASSTGKPRLLIMDERTKALPSNPAPSGRSRENPWNSSNVPLHNPTSQRNPTDRSVLPAQPMQPPPGFQGLSQEIAHPIRPQILEELNLERMYHGIVSYILLLQYCYEHSETIISKIQKPDMSWTDAERHLILTHNAIVQLNLLPRGGPSNASMAAPRPRGANDRYNPPRAADSLFSVINQTSTLMGRRYLRSMLLNPLTSPDQLETYYNMTEELLSFHAQAQAQYRSTQSLNPLTPPQITMEGQKELLSLDALEKHLRAIPDLEKYHRKLSLHLLKPVEFVSLFQGYLHVVELIKLIGNSGVKHLSGLFFDNEIIDDFNMCLNDVFSLINLDALHDNELIDENGRSVPSLRPFDRLLETRGALRMNFLNSFYLPAKDPMSDNQMAKITMAENSLRQVCDHLNVFLRGSRGKILECPEFNGKRKVKLANNQDGAPDDDDPNDDPNARFSMCLTTTNHKASMIRMSMEHVNTTLCGQLQFKTIKNETQITSTRIEQYCRDVMECRAFLENYFATRYVELIATIAKRHQFFNAITRFVAMLDFVKSNARTALKYRYFRPTIVRTNEEYPVVAKEIPVEVAKDDKLTGKSTSPVKWPREFIPKAMGGKDGTETKPLAIPSNLTTKGFKESPRATLTSDKTEAELLESNASFCSFEDIRHPIIEQLIAAEYITNNISLGKNPKGRLLFGLNAVGKSSILEAIGLNIILAQIGSFTAGKLTFRPYSRIITRLSGEGDMFKGQSSFVVELNEIRSILRNGDSRSLVLVDEVCRGTESISGTSIAISTILSLLEKHSSFIISTHLHQMVDTPFIQNVSPSDLQINHLSTNYDESKEQLIYDRKLKTGPGESVYGILVAKFLGFGREFIARAEDVRKNLMDQEKMLVSTKRSRYNSKLFMNECVMCGKTSGLETHHIREQNESHDGKFIDHFNKNEVFNLVPLCHECHAKRIHEEGIKMVAKQTLQGQILVLEKKAP